MDVATNNCDSQHESIDLNQLESLIAKFLDQFTLKDSIIKITSKTPFKVTSELVDTIILLVFLIIIYLEAGILKLEWSFNISILSVLTLSAIVELAYVNTSLLGKYFGKDASTKRFLQRARMLSQGEAKNEIKSLVFSSECMNLFLNSIANDKNLYPPSVIESVVRKQVLSTENMDLLFSPDVSRNVLPDLIMDVLVEYRNALTYNHVLNVYTQFKNNKSMIRLLVATQSNSYFLLENFRDDSELYQYYNEYQMDKKHNDWILKYIKTNIFSSILNWLFWITFLLLLVFYTGTIPVTGAKDVFGILATSGFLAAVIAYFIVGGVLRKIRNYYYSHFKKRVLTLSTE